MKEILQIKSFLRNSVDDFRRELRKDNSAHLMKIKEDDRDAVIFFGIVSGLGIGAFKMTRAFEGNLKSDPESDGRDMLIGLAKCGQLGSILAVGGGAVCVAICLTDRVFVDLTLKEKKMTPRFSWMD